MENGKMGVCVVAYPREWSSYPLELFASLTTWRVDDRVVWDRGVWKPVFRATGGGLGKGAVVVHCHICVSTAVGGHWKCIKIIIAHPPVCGNGLWRLWLKGERVGKKKPKIRIGFSAFLFNLILIFFKAKNRSKCGGQLVRTRYVTGCGNQANHDGRGRTALGGLLMACQGKSLQDKVQCTRGYGTFS
jgi:hypothetical protein